MARQKTDDLMQLIRSMTSAEKRHFRLFAMRHKALPEKPLFLQLFNLLDKTGHYDETFLLKKIPGLKKAQLANLKAHLLRQLLTSLRMLALKNNGDMQAREWIDFARVLYNKGLYRPALNLLAKAKEKALAVHAPALALEVVEFEKHIESQYITRSLEGRAGELARQTRCLNEQNFKTNAFSNLSLQMYSLYLRNGFARSEKDSHQVKKYFNLNLPDIKFSELDFLGKNYFCQAHVWLHYICQDYLACFKYAQKWVNLYEDNPGTKKLFAPFYLKALHNLLNSLFFNVHYERFMEAFSLLQQFPREVSLLNKNTESLFHLYRYMHLINKHYMEGTFSEGTRIVPELLQCLKTNQYNWDEYRLMIFNYRIACLYFGDSDYENSIEYLNKIINKKTTNYRSDIQCFARILSLLSHFELGNTDLLDYQVKSVYRFLLHVEELQAVQKAIFHFLRRTQKTPRQFITTEFKKLHAELLPLQNKHFESRPFLYLDIISWLEAKMEGTTIQHIIRRKFFQKQKKEGRIWPD